MTRTVPRRLRRTLGLARRWLAYLLAADEGSATALADLGRWASTTLLRRDLSDAGLPWLTFPAIRWLEARCRPEWRIFEWGSGASTLFFLRRGCTVVSVEHDARWYRRVADRTPDHPRLVLRLVEPAATDGGADGADGSAAGSFAAYVAAIDDQSDGAFDLVVVDGRARLDCLARSRAKVAAGGGVLLDDSDRDLYRTAPQLFPEPTWRTLHLPGPRPASVWPVFSRTTLFLRR